MKSLYNDEEAKKYKTDLDLRVYTSRLLGQDSSLVLHGGGNTSVKTKIDSEDILFVKGSGWDLVSIKEEGFAPVKLDTLISMAKLESLSDSDMVSQQKEAMIEKNAPNPSVEAILHAIIPFKFVDHTHSDAVVTISNCKNGIENIAKVYPNFLIVPYVMPGFILAQKIYEMAKDIDWDSCEGIILHNHGIFTFDNCAKTSYDKMIDAVNQAEEFLNQNALLDIDDTFAVQSYDIQELRELIEQEKGCDITVKINISKQAVYYASQDNLAFNVTKGVLTPEHIIRTKRIPLVLDGQDISEAIEEYKKEYKNYFNRFAKDEIMLNPTPNYAVIKDYGVVTFGKNEKEANIISDIVEHTINAVLRAEELGGYESISLKDSFDMEYWELEQAKLKKNI
ncbi:MAG: class II aldolase/adducin family protein [Arcobacteraceae bacterium]|nr:class II aldolase/adducin family protein [Arcobacteraceae bacterium]